MAVAVARQGAGFDGVAYVRALQPEQARALAFWLAVQGLDLGEFMEIVDREYAAGRDSFRGRPSDFVAEVGQPIAEAYARRKRRFAGLMAALEEALISSALPGEVAPRELCLSAPPRTKPRRTEEILSTLADFGS